MDWRVFDPRHWSRLQESLGLATSSSSSNSTNSATNANHIEKSNKLKQISEHVFELSKKPESPSAEIIFFHGLQVSSSSKPYITTWLSKDGTELWLGWLLEAFPDVRMLVVSYDASVAKTDHDGRLDIYLTCENLLQELMGRRNTAVGDTGCPIMLVGHCVGGLVLKELCLMVAHRMIFEKDRIFSNFFQSVKGIFCYSSPHHGSPFPDRNASGARGPLFKEPLDAETARRNEEFRMLREKYEWRSEGIGESIEVTLRNFKGLIVPEGSSRQDVDKHYTVVADHFDVCRPESTNCTSYSMLAQLIDEIIKKDKGSMVQVDFPTTFVGLESRIKEVQDLLLQKSRIALVGMGGLGKTALAQALYAKIQKSFDYSCFYEEVKCSTGANETAHQLEENMKSRFADRRGRKIDGALDWNELDGKRVLIVLDDTISRRQVEGIVNINDQKAMVFQREPPHCHSKTEDS